MNCFLVYQYKNIKEKLYKTNAVIRYNENNVSCWFILYGYITMHGQHNFNSHNLFTDITVISTPTFPLVKRTKLVHNFS
jgi:hypothetical protein